MKRIICCLLPWMVMVASAQNLRPAAIQLTHHKEATAYRLNDVCYISPNVLIHWEWAYTFIGSECTLSVGGKTFKVAGKSIENKLLLPVSEILNQLGAEGSWRSDRDVFQILASAKSIKVRDGKISIETNLPVRAKVSFVESPNRLVMDIAGLKLGGAKTELDGSARAAQFTPDLVRLSVFTEYKGSAGNLPEGRSVSYSFTPSRPDQQPTTAPEVTPVETRNPNGISIVQSVGPMSTLAESERSARFNIALERPLSSPPQFRRTAPDSFSIFVPNGRYVMPPGPLNTPSVSAVEPVEDGAGLTLNIRLSRPMGVNFSHSANAIVIGLIKPEVGNGKLAGKTIVVDAGHGGHDSGARAPDGSANEKTLTLAISKRLSEALMAEGATVIMSRDNDYFVSLKERPEIANRNRADFFVSVHINSNRVTNKLSGSISFHHKGSTLGELLAQCIENENKKVSGIPSLGVWSDKRIYDSGFAVLRGSKMPAVLLELGFINHYRDRARLIQPEYHRAIANSIVKGIKVYLGDGN